MSTNSISGTKNKKTFVIGVKILSVVLAIETQILFIIKTEIMVPALLFWLFKKHALPVFNNLVMQFQVDSFHKLLKKKTILSIIALLFTISSFAQEETSTYQIKRNGDIIGQMQFKQKRNGTDTYLKMNSKVKTRFIFEIDVQTDDEAHFKNGQLVFSTVYRKVNGREKERKETKLINQSYLLQAGNKSNAINGSINYNMMLLYCKEPVNIAQVYSDSFQQVLAIKRMAPNTYRINLPDGNYNDYYFQNGICKTVKVHHSLYTITMELV